MRNRDLRYDVMVGVGGIGSGSFFAISGDHTLGREESRGGRFLDRRDYCKLHIISHYVKMLLGDVFLVMPVGKVGSDDVGSRLLAEMQEAGLDLRFVGRSDGDQTLFSFCFVYPDGSGGNLTTEDSACSKVDPGYVALASEKMAQHKGRGIALAVPEAPVGARARLMELASEHNFLRVASFTSEEIPHALASGLMTQIDLLAINVDEAAAVVGSHGHQLDQEAIVKIALDKLSQINSRMLVSVTAGAAGSWSFDGSVLNHIPVLDVKAVSTAGAGDAHLSGIIAGLVHGLTLAHAQELGNLVGAMSVTSPHTINKEITVESLKVFARNASSGWGSNPVL